MREDKETDPIADAYLLWITGANTDLAGFNYDLLSTRARRAIRESKCQSPFELSRFGSRAIGKIHNTGKTTVIEIENYLRINHGLRLTP